MSKEKLKEVNNFDITKWESEYDSADNEVESKEGKWELHKGICSLGGCYKDTVLFNSYDEALMHGAFLSLMGETMDASTPCSSCYNEYIRNCI